MKGNLHLIGLGGAGINITVDVLKYLERLKGYDLANVDIRLLDTSDRTIAGYPEFNENFRKLVSFRGSINELDGTGGERKDMGNLRDITENVRHFMDEQLPNNINDFYVLVFSASGGTGSVLGPLLLKAMLEKNYTLTLVVVGDTSTSLTTNNTVKTLSSLASIAKLIRKPITITYYNNAVNGISTPKTEKQVNEKIKKVITVLSVFLSGTNRNLDNTDMRNFFNPTYYKSFKIDSGLYGLGLAIGELNDKFTIMARTLINNGMEDLKISVNLLHNKVGIIDKKNGNLFENCPLFLLFRKDIMAEEIKNLDKILREQTHTASTEVYISEGDNIDGLVL